MVLTLLVLVVCFFLFEAIGSGIHRLMHTRWAGPLWRSHMEHHRAYSPRDGLSDTYRNIGSNSAAFRYVALGAVVAIIFLLTLPLGLALALSAEMLLVGWLNDRLHDASHLNHHWLDRFSWFQKLRDLHQVHHRNMAFNFGLLTFLLDRFFKTYRV